MVNRRFIGLMAAVLLLVAATGVYFENSAAQHAASGGTRTVTTSICCALTPGPTTTVFTQVTENIPTTTTLTSTATSTSTATTTSLICCQTTTVGGGPAVTTTTTTTTTVTTTVTTTATPAGLLSMVVGYAVSNQIENPGSSFVVSISVSNSSPQTATFYVFPSIQSSNGGNPGDITFAPTELTNQVIGYSTTPMQMTVTVSAGAPNTASYVLAFVLQSPAFIQGSLTETLPLTLGQISVNGNVGQGFNEQNGVTTASCTLNVQNIGDVVVDMVASFASGSFSARDTFGDSLTQMASYQVGGLDVFGGAAQRTGSDTVSVTLPGSSNVFSQCYDIPQGQTTGVIFAGASGSSTSARTSSPLSIGSSSIVLAIIRANSPSASPSYSAQTPFVVSNAGTVSNGLNNYDGSVYGEVSSSTSCPIQLSVTDSWDMLCIAIPV